MAWDLWSSSFDQVASGDCCSDHSEWKCDFYFGFGRDVLEEDAINEESCVRVLRILLTKGDTEIEELERDLLSLQEELAWVEHEKWPEICCSALTERINLLDVAISALKNDHADGTEMQLLLPCKPAESLNEIVKALQRDHCQDTLGQHLDTNILNPTANVTEQVPDEDSSTVDSNLIIKEEGKESCGTSENSRSSELILELHEKRSDIPEKIEVLPAKCRVRTPDRGAISCAPDHSDEMKLSETSYNEVPGNEEIKRSQLLVVSTDTGQILNMLSFKDNVNIPSEAKNENVNVKEKDDSSDDSRLAIGIKRRKKYLHSKLGTSQQPNPGNSDLDKKLCDFAPKTARRACKKETKVAPDEHLASMELPLQIVYPKTLCLTDTEYSCEESNGNNSERLMNIDDATFIHAENAALISLLGIQSKSTLYTELQLTDEDKPLALGYKSEIAASLSPSSMGFPSKLKAQGKLKPKLEASSLEELESCTEVIPRTSLSVSTKRQRKSKTCTDGAILNQSMNRKNTKRAGQPLLHEAESGAIVLYDSKLSELKKRRISKLPITVEIQNSTVNLDVANSETVSLDNGSQVDHINKYSLVASHDETFNALKKMTLSNLRAMAKQHNVKKYYKLAKGALVEQLVKRLSCC